MYSCRLCDKSYQSRGSLSRHLRNHSVGSSQHVCPTCDVVFSRRDLLRRHVQIHRPSDNACVAPSGSDRRSKSAPRRRCHTACQPCREARVKCNGENPCDQCASSQTECVFRPRARRVSRVVEMDSTMQGNELNADGGSTADDAVASPSQPEAAMQAEPAMLQSPISNMNSPVMPFFGAPEPMLEVDNMDQTTGMDFSWATHLPCNTGSWPWLHEALFLQDSTNSMLNWTNEFNSSPLDLANLAQDAGLDSFPDASAPPTSASGGVFSPARPITASKQTKSLPAPEHEEARDHPSSQHPDATDSKSQMALRERIVDELVEYASNQTVTSGSRLSWSLFWKSMSIRIAEAYCLDSWQSGEPHSTLNRMMKMYEENFSPLWPLLSGRDFDETHLHPLLFLTVVSIGCMYGNPRECQFGNMLHEHIRHHLAGSLAGLGDGEVDLLWLGQARLLTQVAALYFGQRRAFSCAQHLGAIIVAQARRMDLFSASGSDISGDLPVEQQLNAWHSGESRTRLAFGILRADVFTSVLLNTRPFLSAEEVYLDLPGDDEIWRNLGNLPADQLAARLKAEPPSVLGLPFSDLVRIAADRGETLLSMNARGYELLMFGLQEHVWRFSHDRGMFPRLTGFSDARVTQKQDNNTPSPSGTGGLSIAATCPSDRLGLTYRQMNDLGNDRRRITETLQKWEQSFTATRTTQAFSRDRSTVMSSMLLLYISYLRLCAPLADLYSVAYNLIDKNPVDRKKLQVLYEWTRSAEAKQAVENVCQIWSLLLHETIRPGPDKAKYNLLAFSGLHHAAVVIWAFAGAHHEHSRETPELPGWKDMVPIPLQRGHNRALFRAIVGLYKQLIPRGWYSFAAAAEHLGAQPFPDLTSA